MRMRCMKRVIVDISCYRLRICLVGARERETERQRDGDGDGQREREQFVRARELVW